MDVMDRRMREKSLDFVGDVWVRLVWRRFGFGAPLKEDLRRALKDDLEDLGVSESSPPRKNTRVPTSNTGT